MTLDDYQKLAARTINPEQSHRDNLANFALGLWEAGEAGNHIKKHLYHGHDLDPDYMKDELGDLLWYIAGLASTMGMSLDEVAQGNVDKLRGRYPEGWDNMRSINRTE